MLMQSFAQFLGVGPRTTGTFMKPSSERRDGTVLTLSKASKLLSETSKCSKFEWTSSTSLPPLTLRTSPFEGNQMSKECSKVSVRAGLKTE
ncbi:hypothetical protein TrST_g1923 [Triparma strigata]|uniref:Uncharacterized protein n=2 Tax=Triparma TaxID=722752 RepID=A0A9W7ARP2_9STRA|nr:hypothetical protein TrST_g1923 [Triparma strigata]GMH99610.1 hypothetical protein TrLO_g5913 [Triparma laevis f. longispina]